MQNHVVSEEVIPPCVGQFVACKLKKFEDEKPQIGQVISLLDGGKIVIEWWVGSYSSMPSVGKVENQRGYTSARNGRPKYIEKQNKSH